MAAERLPDLSLDLILTPLKREARPLREWLTTFHLAPIVLDPYTRESSWILKTAARVMHQFAGAAVRVNFLMTSDAHEARSFLGPLADQFLVFCDPDRVAVRALGLTELPSFLLIQSDGTIPIAAQGWNPADWREVSAHIAALTSWSKPTLPAPGDPVAFRGSPALV
ncbi:MAG: hypothetical protein FJW53_07630 [Actinobacteria bacterium]|nr:hypothetical protein [Actinomycetota bacterium]